MSDGKRTTVNGGVGRREEEIRTMTSVRCDKQMRRSKEKAGEGIRDIRRFKCTGECKSCICGMIKRSDGTWEHIQLR